jgi:glycosyltransferase involved in cell wall biosynthesis
LIAFSIIICTHNGKNRLKDTLHCLEILDLNQEIDYEVIVVDNASDELCFDEFNFLVSKFSRNDKFKYLVELEKGKDLALVKGLINASNDWIIICDDDNWIQPNYLIVAKMLIERYRDVMLFGSRSIPEFQNGFEVPEWFSKNALRYACGTQYAQSGYLTFKQDIWGAGSIINKRVLKFILESEKLILTNRRGEDTEIFYRLILLDFKAFYSSELLFKHYMPESRLSEENHLNMIQSDKSSRSVLEKYHKFIKYYHFNNLRFLSKIKWIFIGFLKKFLLLKGDNSGSIGFFIDLHSFFTKDKDLKSIKSYYSKARKIRI